MRPPCVWCERCTFGTGSTVRRAASCWALITASCGSIRFMSSKFARLHWDRYFSHCQNCLAQRVPFKSRERDERGWKMVPSGTPDCLWRAAWVTSEIFACRRRKRYKFPFMQEVTLFIKNLVLHGERFCVCLVDRKRKAIILYSPILMTSGRPVERWPLSNKRSRTATWCIFIGRDEICNVIGNGLHLSWDGNWQAHKKHVNLIAQNTRVDKTAACW